MGEGREAVLQRLARVMATDVDRLGYLEPLDVEELERLHDLLQRSIGAEEARLHEALQATMRFLPRPLRGRAKRVLFPEGHR